MTKSSFYSANEGILAGLTFRLTLTSSLIGIIIFLIDPGIMKWSQIMIHPFIRLSGVVFGVCAIILFYWALRSLGNNFFASLKMKEGHQLITSGLYKWSRHPMYVAFVIMWLSFFLLSANWFIGSTGLVTYVIIFIWRIPKEERMLTEHFGARYLNYKKQTGLFGFHKP
ncbi:MAG: isoprenylcysteine carboxylmethyltransferase family protein [Bacteroidales bacterium]|nr:isoprenylcysteine carboxylmethyltransferase family protein [Bacteroidales bacterium]